MLTLEHDKKIKFRNSEGTDFQDKGRALPVLKFYKTYEFSQSFIPS